MTVPREAEPAISPTWRATTRRSTEEITAENLEVIGELPDDLAGMFIRTGSNPRFHPNGRYHWFDGDGMLHGLEIEDGSATYRNRYIRTKGLEDDLAAGRSLRTGIMEQPDVTNPDGPWKDTANTDLVFHSGKLLALWWLSGKAHQIRLPDLETEGPCDFGGTLDTNMASHAKVDPATGEMIFIDYGPVPPYLRYGVVSPDGRGGALDADRAARLPAPARRRHHREPRAAVRHVDDVGPGGDEAGPRAPGLLPRAREPHRRDPALRRRHRRAVVRGRAVLHVPHDHVLGGGRRDRDGRLPDPRPDGLGGEGQERPQHRRCSATCGSSPTCRSGG